MEQLLFTPFHPQLFPPLIAIAAENVFILFILNYIPLSKRVEIIWDTYKANSIKDSAREKRGKGQRRKVTGDTKITQSKLESISPRQYQQERTLCPPEKRSFKLPVSREYGNKHHLRRICSLKQRFYWYTEMWPRGSRQKNRCICSTRAEQRMQSGFCPHSGYGCSCHNDRDFSWLDRFVSLCSHLDWFWYGEIWLIHQCECHLRISWPWNVSGTLYVSVIYWIRHDLLFLWQG